MDRIKIESKSLGAMEVALTQEIFTLKKKKYGSSLVSSSTIFG